MSKEYQREAIIAAMELGYSIEVITAIYQAKSDAEISRILSRARNSMK